MVGLMILRVRMRSFALVFFFTLCQVMGTVCALPDLTVAEGMTSLVENGMVCPMHGTNICPLPLTSSPERQIKDSIVKDVGDATTLLSPAVALTVPSGRMLWCWSSDYSLVPLSISSSSVLRI